MKPKHYVFYDGDCPFCLYSVRTLLKIDKRKELAFAPLQGSTAKEKLRPYQAVLERHGISSFSESDSIVVLVQGKKLFVRGKAVLNLFWELGGVYKWIGCLHVLPAWFYDWFYRFIASRRKRIFKVSCPLPSNSQRDQFLP